MSRSASSSSKLPPCSMVRTSSSPLFSTMRAAWMGEATGGRCWLKGHRRGSRGWGEARTRLEGLKAAAGADLGGKGGAAGWAAAAGPAEAGVRIELGCGSRRPE
jgi:hypothetical protein